jgi:ATP-dependent phosphofructokinase / diphosphate-dependent phosphofructokinase
VDEEELLANVAAEHRGRGHVFLVVNEMLRDARGDLIGQEFQRGPKDNLGRVMYSLSLGTGNYLADLIWRRLGLQSRCLRPGSLGRAMSAMVSEPDRVLASSVGKAAAFLAIARERSGTMVTVDGSGENGTRGFEESSGTRGLPREFLTEGSMGISSSFVTYASPLIGVVDPVVGPIY